MDKDYPETVLIHNTDGKLFFVLQPACVPDAVEYIRKDKAFDFFWGRIKDHILEKLIQ